MHREIHDFFLLFVLMKQKIIYFSGLEEGRGELGQDHRAAVTQSHVLSLLLVVADWRGRLRLEAGRRQAQDGRSWKSVLESEENPWPSTAQKSWCMATLGGLPLARCLLQAQAPQSPPVQITKHQVSPPQVHAPVLAPFQTAALTPAQPPCKRSSSSDQSDHSIDRVTIL